MRGASVRLIADRRAWADLLPRWHELFLTPGTERSPFLAPGWCNAWLQVFGGRLRVLVAEKSGRLVGIAPLLRVGSLCPIYVGVGQEIADYGGFLIDGRDPGAVADALLRSLEAWFLRAPALVSLGRVPTDTSLHRCAIIRYPSSEGLVLTTWRSDLFPYLDLGQFEDPGRHVEKLKKRNDVRRRLRRLEERHDVQFEFDTASDPSAIDDFFRLHDLRWEGKAEDAAGPFVTARGREFLRRAVSDLAPAGLIRLSFVRVDGERVVGRFGFQLGDTYFGAKSAFDPKLAASGPGHLAVAFLLDEAVARGLHRFDFMRGEGAHKSAWTDTTSEVPYLWLHHAGGAGVVERRAAHVRLAMRYRYPAMVRRVESG